MTHAASAVTARGLALAGAAPANFLRHNPKSADSKAWFATEAPSANAAGPPRFHHLPPACLALAGATCHSHSSSLNRIVVHRVTPITTMAKPSHCVFGNSRRVALTDTWGERTGPSRARRVVERRPLRCTSFSARLA
ncbi:unnamed protein product [Candidatus Paraburkholderia kirkii UZHbot1]|uniref:WGS project CAFE00000000 data, contig bkir_c242 n=1 Tax=Candidatus Paraburkholderia kirkii UZHbot1 TaxID=1055526 RepID=U3UAR4_9BURK|nr:unnamed protein product [Candidatus Paraburkholderia kirkii UZHbot1]